MRMKVIGDIKAFAPDIQQSVRELEEYSKDFDGIYFQLALNYGSVMRSAVECRRWRRM